MDCTGLTQNFDTGLYEDAHGRAYVRCAFDEDNPVFIDVTNDRWSVSYQGDEKWLDWSRIDLPSRPLGQLKAAVARNIETRSPHYVSKMRSALLNLSSVVREKDIELSQGLGMLNVKCMRQIWSGVDAGSRSLLRGIFGDLAAQNDGAFDLSLIKEMRDWKARDGLKALESVVLWDPILGALTTAEAEVLRQALSRWQIEESDSDCAARIFGWISQSLLKRTSQLTAMRKDALCVFGNDGAKQFFLRIPPVKAQASRKPELWQITEQLGLAILAYSGRPAIQKLQVRFDRLIVMPKPTEDAPRWMEHGQVSSWFAGNALRDWVTKQGLVSPRTNAPMHVRPLRLRHTGATGMAKQGCSRQEIQDALEQDSPQSAQAYIDSIAEDLLPLYEKTSDRLGDVFRPLKESYFFQGTVVASPPRKPIAIPVVVEGQAPAVVGGCGKDGACHRHPFLACYDNCPSFLAWKDGPHDRALKYVESEFKRWNTAEEGAVRSKSIKDFDRAAAGIREVITQINATRAEEEGK